MSDQSITGRCEICDEPLPCYICAMANELTRLRAENASLKTLLTMAEEGLEYTTTWAPMTLTCRTRLIEALAAIRAKGGEIVKAKDFYAERERTGEVKAVKSAPVESTINLIDAVEAWMLAAPAIEREVPSAQGEPIGVVGKGCIASHWYGEAPPEGTELYAHAPDSAAEITRLTKELEIQDAEYDIQTDKLVDSLATIAQLAERIKELEAYIGGAYSEVDEAYRTKQQLAAAIASLASKDALLEKVRELLSKIRYIESVSHDDFGAVDVFDDAHHTYLVEALAAIEAYKKGEVE